MSLEAAADISTIVAMFLASGALITWMKNQHYKRKPLSIPKATYYRFPITNGAATLLIELKNHLTSNIQIQSAILLGKARYEIQVVNGELWDDEYRPHSSYSLTYTPSQEITAGAKSHLVFKYSTTAEADRVNRSARILSLTTDRGVVHIPLKSFDVRETKGGSVSYHDIAYTRIGRWQMRFRYWWWKHCLSNAAQQEFIVHRDLEKLGD